MRRTLLLYKEYMMFNSTLEELACSNVKLCRKATPNSGFILHIPSHW